jgi:hypothetical protein
VEKGNKQMETIYKTDFRVGSNIINLIRKEGGYAVTNRSGKDLGFISRDFGWCFYGHDEVSSQFAKNVSKEFPFGNMWREFIISVLGE